MSVVLQYDSLGVVTLFRKRADTPLYDKMPNTLINPDLSQTVSPAYFDWRVVNRSTTPRVREMTDPEKTARDDLIKQAKRDAANADQINEQSAIIALWKVIKSNNPVLADQWRAQYEIEEGI